MSFQAERRPLQQVSRLFDGGIRMAEQRPAQRPAPPPPAQEDALAANPENPVGHASRFFTSSSRSPAPQHFPTMQAMPASEFPAASGFPAMAGREFAPPAAAASMPSL